MSIEEEDKDRREPAQCRVSGSEQVGEEGLQSPVGLGGRTHLRYPGCIQYRQVVGGIFFR